MKSKYCVWRKDSTGRLVLVGCFWDKKEALRVKKQMLKKAKKPSNVVIKRDRY